MDWKWIKSGFSTLRSTQRIILTNCLYSVYLWFYASPFELSINYRYFLCCCYYYCSFISFTICTPFIFNKTICVWHFNSFSLCFTSLNRILSYLLLLQLLTVRSVWNSYRKLTFKSETLCFRSFAVISLCFNRLCIWKKMLLTRRLLRTKVNCLLLFL